MTRLITALALVAAAGAGLSLRPLFEAPGPARFEAEGAREIRHENADRIDAVLSERGPGLGLRLRGQVAAAIAEESERAGFDPLFVLGLMSVESEFRTEAVSAVGARGLMQFRPDTLAYVAQQEGVRLSKRELDRDPALQVRLGIRYLKSLEQRFGSLDLALMAYNAGPTKIRDLLNHRRPLEPYRGYVRAVRQQEARLRSDHQTLFASAQADVAPVE